MPLVLPRFILGEVTDSTESTSGSCSSELPPPPVSNPKALQSRRSLLELMQAERKEREGPEEDLPAAKRQKVDKEQEVREEFVPVSAPLQDEEATFSNCFKRGSGQNSSIVVLICVLVTCMNSRREDALCI